MVGPPIITDAQQQQSLCESPDCRHERLYIGRMAQNSEVLLQPGHKWNNIVFHNHTGLRQYPNYMMVRVVGVRLGMNRKNPTC